MMQEIAVVTPMMRKNLGRVGALSWVPGMTEPASACVLSPNGSTANSVIHHVMKNTAKAEMGFMGLVL